MDEGDVVNTLGLMRKDITDPLATFTMLLEFPFGTNDHTFIFMPTSAKGFYLDGFIIELVKFRFVVERVDLTRPTIHEKKNNVFCFGQPRRHFLSQRIVVGSYSIGRQRLGGEKSIFGQQAGQGDGTKAPSRFVKKLATGAMTKLVGRMFFHDVVTQVCTNLIVSQNVGSSPNK